MLRRLFYTLMSILLLAGNAPAAEMVRGRWQKVDIMPAGTPITVTTNPGEQVSCIFFSSDRDTILVVETSGTQRRILKSIIQSIVAEKYDDRLRNGSIWGLSAGLTFAALLATVPRDMSQRGRVSAGVFGGVLFGLAGMGLGALADYHIQGRELIYQAAAKKE
jgi:hypothetical protein